MADLATFRRAGDGADDAPAINRLLAAGGGELTGGPYTLLTPLVYGSGVRFDCRATLLYRRGWASGHAITSAAIMGREAVTRDVVLDFRQGGSIILPGAHDPAAPRKGIAIRKVDGFQVYGPTVTGDGGLFSLEVVDSRRGLVKGGRLSTLPADIGQQGADGSHNTGNVEDVEYLDLDVFSGDDASSFCNEIAQFAGSVTRNVTYRSCTLRARGHSAIKLLMLPPAGASLIERIRWLDCTFVIDCYDQSGAPFSLRNLARAQGAVARDLLIQGGSLEVRRPATVAPAAPMEPVIRAEGIEALRFRDFAVKTHFSRQLLVSAGCPGRDPIWDASCTAAPNPAIAPPRTALAWMAQG